MLAKFINRLRGNNSAQTTTTALGTNNGSHHHQPATTNQGQGHNRSMQQSGNSQLRNQISRSIQETLGTVGSYAIPPIIVGLIMTILLFICTWIIAQAISQLFGIHRQFMVVSLAFLIGAILAGTARLVWGMSGVAVGIGHALKNLLASAEASNWDRKLVLGRLFLIGGISSLFILITLFCISILGGVGFYVTSQTTSNNLFAFNTNEMLQTGGAPVNQADLQNRAIGILPQMEAGRMLAGINSAGIKPAANAPKSAPTATHTVKRGDTLNAIAARYGITLSALKQANNLKSNHIEIGQTLVIPAK